MKKMKKTTIAILGILTVVAVLSVSSASASHEVPSGYDGIFYLVPDDSSVSEYCSSTVVQVWLNSTAEFQGGAAFIKWTYCCANATSFELNDTVFDTGIGNIAQPGWFNFSFEKAPGGVPTNVSAGEYHLANVTLHCCDETPPCETNLSFFCEPAHCTDYWGKFEEELIPAYDNGTFTCGEDMPNLVVNKNHPGYVFSNLTNVMTAKVTNSGDVTTGSAFSVNMTITNAAGTLFSNTIDNVGALGAGSSTTVNFGNWKPTKVETITINVTVDYGGAVTESNEAHNSRVETRNPTGSCADTGSPYQKFFEKECYGYRGQNPLTEKYVDGSDVLYTVGDYDYLSGYKKRLNYSVNFTIGAPGGDVNRVDSYIADIPAGATIKEARLYLYYNSWKNKTHGLITGHTSMTFVKGACNPGAAPIAADDLYTDIKGFGTSMYGEDRQYGTIAYDVTAVVTGDDSYCGYLISNEDNTSGAARLSYSGMALMVIYDDGTPMVYRIAEGCDRLATNYGYTGTSASSYHVTSDDNATTSATLTDANPSGDVTYARLFTATVDAVDKVLGTAGYESLNVNGYGWTVGAWTNEETTGGTGHPIGFDRSNVTSCLSGAGSAETVQFQERDGSNSNGYSAVFAILQACNQTLTNVTACDASGNEKHSFLVADDVYVMGSLDAGNYSVYIQPHPVTMGEALVAGNDPSTTQEWINLTSADESFGPTQIWVNIPGPVTYTQYDIILDKDGEGAGVTGNYSANDGADHPCVEGYLAPVPEFATIALFGMGLLTLTGYVYLGRRRKRA